MAKILSEDWNKVMKLSEQPWVEQLHTFMKSGKLHSPCVMALILPEESNNIMKVSEQVWAEQPHTFMKSSAASRHRRQTYKMNNVTYYYLCSILYTTH